MKPIAKVNVFGKIVPVFFEDGVIEREQAFGYFQVTDQRTDDQKIVVDGDLSTTEAAKVLVHELFHAVLHRTHISSGMPDAMEEVVVEQLATAVVENLKIIQSVARRGRAS